MIPVKNIRLGLYTHLKLKCVLLSILFSISLFSFNKNQRRTVQNEIQNNRSMKIKISVGKKVFIATLNNNATAIAFKAKLPITINMNELNDNEKYSDLPFGLPSNQTNPKTINTGDLMIYGGNTSVLFYKTFSASYSYTVLGRIDEPLGLDSTLGPGNVTVTYEAFDI